MRPVFLASRGDPTKKGQAVPRNSKLHRDRLVSGLAANGSRIRVGDVFGGITHFTRGYLSNNHKIVRIGSNINLNETYYNLK